MSLLDCFRRANSHIRYFYYRRSIGKPFPLSVTVGDWFRRLAFEIKHNWRVKP